MFSLIHFFPLLLVNQHAHPQFCLGFFLFFFFNIIYSCTFFQKQSASSLSSNFPGSKSRQTTKHTRSPSAEGALRSTGTLQHNARAEPTPFRGLKYFSSRFCQNLVWEIVYIHANSLFHLLIGIILPRTLQSFLKIKMLEPVFALDSGSRSSCSMLWLVLLTPR